MYSLLFCITLGQLCVSLDFSYLWDQLLTFIINMPRRKSPVSKIFIIVFKLYIENSILLKHQNAFRVNSFYSKQFCRDNNVLVLVQQNIYWFNNQFFISFVEIITRLGSFNTIFIGSKTVCEHNKGDLKKSKRYTQCNI